MTSVVRLTTVKLSYTFFFFNDTATTEIYTLSLHDALPISAGLAGEALQADAAPLEEVHVGLGEVLAHHGHQLHLGEERRGGGDRKSTRLNSSHANISYAVFCLKKKKTQSIK